MRRSLGALILLVAVSIAVEPIVHTHPLTQNASSTQCALCVNAHAAVTTLKPATVSLLVLLGRVVAVHSAFQQAPPDLAVASRAPPAA